MPIDADEVPRIAHEIAIGDRPPTAELALDLAKWLDQNEGDDDVENDLRVALRQSERKVEELESNVEKLEDHIEELEGQLVAFRAAVNAARVTLDIVPLTVILMRPSL
jgi:phage shock protein A